MEITAKHLKADAVQVRTLKPTAKRRVVFVHLLIRPPTAVINLEQDVLDLNETVVEVVRFPFCVGTFALYQKYFPPKPKN